MPSGAISVPRKLRAHISSQEEEDCKLGASWGVPPANLPPEFPSKIGVRPPFPAPTGSQVGRADQALRLRESTTASTVTRNREA